MSKTPAEKRLILADRTAAALNITEKEAVALLRTNRRQSVRVNPLRSNPTLLRQLRALGWAGEHYAWMPDGYTIDHAIEAIRDSTLITSGMVFIQNAASWLPVVALDPRPGDDILDVCAAPGGKASHIAAMTNNQAQLTVNDNSRARLAKMQANFKRLGVTPAEVTLFDASQLARKLEGRQFDKILLDAPCSGEGMMHYDQDTDFASWSVAHIKRLQQLQKRILTQAWQLLKPGGILIYSTCTMAPEENEAVVDYMVRTRPDARIEPFDIDLPNRVHTVPAWNGKAYDPRTTQCLRLAPSETIEAFFVCKLRKTALPADKTLAYEYS